MSTLVLPNSGRISVSDIAVRFPVKFSELARLVNITKDSRSSNSKKLSLTEFYGFAFREIASSCSVYLTSHFNSSGSVIDFGGVEFDAHDDYSTSNGSFTAPITGVYLVALGGYTRNTSDVPFELRVNGDAVRKISVYDISGDDSEKRNGIHFTHILELRAGDKLQGALTSSGGELRGGYGLSDLGRTGYMQVTYLQDATREGCAFTSWMESGSRSFGSGDRLRWGNLLFDLDNRCWSASDNKFVVPVDGVYCFAVGGHVDQTDDHMWTLHLNGSRVRRYSPYATVSWSSRQAMGQCMAQTLHLSSGDEVYVESLSSSPQYYGSSSSTDIGDAFYFSGALLQKTSSGASTAAAVAYANSSTSNTEDPIQFDATDHDLSGNFSQPRYNAPLTGVYLVCTGAYIRNYGDDALPFHIERNGSMIRRMPLYAMANHDSDRRLISTMAYCVQLNRGDELTVSRTNSTAHYRGGYSRSDIGRNAYMLACLLSRTGMQASGGDEVFTAGGYVVHVFKNSGTFEVSRGALASVDVLVVGGGGGAPSTGSDTAGGGAGGLIMRPGMRIGRGSFSVTVGNGGSRGGNGGDSSFKDLVALGGGGNSGNGSGSSGGSGSGGGRDGGSGGSGLQPNRSGDSGRFGYGTAGGDNSGSGSEGAGGGGAGEKGASITDGGSKESGTTVKKGGDGLDMSEYFGMDVGDDGWFAGGGGGGGARGSGSKFETGGGKGGGGRGGHPVWDRDGEDGRSNTGGGGGGTDNGTGGRGGSGVVIIRYTELMKDDVIDDNFLQKAFNAAEREGYLDDKDVEIPVAVYAPRRLFRSYSGPQVRIFRKDNGLLANVYFDKDGSIILVRWDNGDESPRLDVSDRVYMVDRLYNQGSGGPLFHMKGYIDGGTLENPSPDTFVYIDQSDATIVIEFANGSQTFQFGLDRDRVTETKGTHIMSLFINSDSNNGSSFHAPDISLEDGQPREGNTQRQGDRVVHTIDIPANRAVLAGLQYRTSSSDTAAQKMHTLVLDDNSESIAETIVF